MPDNLEPASQNDHVGGEGALAEVGKISSNKTPFFIAGIVAVLLVIGGGAAFVQTTKKAASPAPTQSAKRAQPLRMETFTKEQIENQVTIENVEERIRINELASEYGLDRNSMNNTVVNIFSDALKE